MKASVLLALTDFEACFQILHSMDYATYPFTEHLVHLAKERDSLVRRIPIPEDKSK